MFAPPPIDVELLSTLNRPGTPWLDAVMHAASSSVPLLGIAALGALYACYRSPHRWLAAVLLLASVGLADLVAVRVVKPRVARVRPCREDPVHVKFPDGCGTGKSFPSAHAADSAAAATVFSWAVPALTPIAVAITVLVGASRVYLGVHWPTDVIGGWALGVALGAALVLLARLRYLRG